VLLEGQAYFEVAASKPRPFVVKVNDADLTVTGTRFIVTSYANENLSKATLAEGHLNVNSGGVQVPVAPSQSASFTKGGKPKVKREPDMDKILAWKDNRFYWEGDSLTTALSEVSRWYDVSITYVDKPTTVLNIVMDQRDKPFKDVMDNLMKSDTNFTYDLRERILYIRKKRLH
jgi:ferric-dicitrate binding protein FerR (iron transport regulator)